MNHLLDTNHERKPRKGLDKAISVMLGPFFPKSTRPLPVHEISDGLDGINVELEQRRLVAALDMTHEALADDALRFTCFKCRHACEDWDGAECETCGKFHCDDCLVTDQQAMAPECCHACDRENREIQATYDTLGRPD